MPKPLRPLWTSRIQTNLVIEELDVTSVKPVLLDRRRLGDVLAQTRRKLGSGPDGVYKQGLGVHEREMMPTERDLTGPVREIQW
jgi:hypothetical protein